MMRSVNVASWVVWASLLAAVLGCEPTDQSGAPTGGGSSPAAAAPQNATEDLKVLGRAYLDYHDANRAGPPSWDALLEYAAERDHSVDAIQRVRDAGYQVKWGARIQDATEGVDNYIIAESPGGGPKLAISGAVIP